MVGVELLLVDILTCPDTCVLSEHASGVCCLPVSSCKPHTQLWRLQVSVTDITVTSYLAATVCASMATTPDIHLPDVRERNTDHAKPQHRNLIFVPVGSLLRTCRPQPCGILPRRLSQDRGRMVRQSPLSPIVTIRSHLRSCSCLSCNGPADRTADPLSDNENSEVGYFFVAARQRN